MSPENLVDASINPRQCRVDHAVDKVAAIIVQIFDLHRPMANAIIGPPPAVQPTWISSPCQPTKTNASTSGCREQAASAGAASGETAGTVKQKIICDRKASAPPRCAEPSEFLLAKISGGGRRDCGDYVCDALISLNEKSDSNPSTTQWNCQLVPYWMPPTTPSGLSASELGIIPAAIAGA